MKSYLNPLVLIAVGFILGALMPCHAGSLQASAGSTGNALVGQLEYGWMHASSCTNDGLARLESGITVVGPSEHHHGYAQFQGHQAPNYFGDTTLVVGAGPLELGAGIAFIQETDAYNSEGLNFRLMGGYHRGHFHLAWNHFSNARIKHPNMGRDMVLVGWDL